MLKEKDLDVIHCLPGRVRYKVTGLRQRPELLAFINSGFMPPGIVMAKASARSQTALIIYDPLLIGLREVTGYLQNLGLASDCPAAAAMEVSEAGASISWQGVEFPRALDLLNSHPQRGLDVEVARHRLAIYGPNRLLSPVAPSFLARLLKQLNEFLVHALLGSSIVCAVMGEVVDALAIVTILVVNAVLGALQEGKAEGSLRALKEMTAPTARVIRGGKVLVIPAELLVPGDIIMLEQGDSVPADLLLLDSNSLEAEESALTGESCTVAKHPGVTEMFGSPGDCHNMLFMGTAVVRGRARALVVSTGLKTELGKIACMLNEVESEATPLQKNMGRVAAAVLKASLAVSGLVVLMGLIRGGAPAQMLLTGVSLTVAAVPEGLPAIVTIAMASGVHKMARSNAIVKKLSAVESIGSATVICTDKTGTLTRNEQMVKLIYCPGSFWWQATGSGYDPGSGVIEPLGGLPPGKREDMLLTLGAAALCGNASLYRTDNSGGQSKTQGSVWKVNGDPCEGAVLAACRKAGLDVALLNNNFKRNSEDPFDSAKRKMHVVCQGPGRQLYTFLKGAPETVLPLCTKYRSETGEEPLNNDIKLKIGEAGQKMARAAMRVLAVAYRDTWGDTAPESMAGENLVFLGLLAMLDPPRQEAAGAIRQCQEAGIAVKMITGDHPSTALAVARELRLVNSPVEVLTGEALDRLGEDKLDRAVLDNCIFARIQPRHKLVLVQALKRQGHRVVMIGDGVNDAPAVKAANVGVAMGLNGTDVTRQAADIILMDDNFSTVVGAIEQGRGIYSNIRNSVRYLLATNAGEVFLAFLAVAAGLPMPLLPIHFLWLNLLGDGLPAVALGVDKYGYNLMKKPPMAMDVFFDSEYNSKIIRRGLVTGATSFAVFWLGLKRFGLPSARTMTLSSATVSQLLHALEVRKQGGAGAGHLLSASLAISMSLLLAAIYWPWARVVLKTTPLGWPAMAASLAGAALGPVLDTMLGSSAKDNLSKVTK